VPLPTGCSLSSRRAGSTTPSGARPVAPPHETRRPLLLEQVLLGMFFPRSLLSGTSCVSSSLPPSAYSPIKPFTSRTLDSPHPGAASRRAARRRPARVVGRRRGRHVRLGRKGGGGATAPACPCSPLPPSGAAGSREGSRCCSPSTRPDGAEEKAARCAPRCGRSRAVWGPGPVSARGRHGSGSRRILQRCAWAGSFSSPTGRRCRLVLVCFSASSGDEKAYFLMGTELGASAIHLYLVVAVSAWLCSSCNRNGKPYVPTHKQNYLL